MIEDHAVAAAASALWSMHGVEGETPADFLDSARIATAAVRAVIVSDIEAARRRLNSIAITDDEIGGVIAYDDAIRIARGGA